MISPKIWEQCVRLPRAPRGSTLDAGLCEGAGSQFRSVQFSCGAVLRPCPSLAQLPSSALRAGHVEPFLRSRALLRPAQEEQRQQQQQPPAKTSLPSHCEASHGEHISGGRWCSLSLQCHRLALAEESVMENWISALAAPVYPSAKSRSETSPPTNEPLQFWCGGLCVSLSGAQGQIVLIKS